MQYQYVIQSIKSKKFWSNNAGWTKNLQNACLYEDGHIIDLPATRVVVKVKVITKVVRAWQGIEVLG